MKKYLTLLLLITFATVSAQAQEIRTELFMGTEEPALDIFWIEPFGKGSPFVFLSRNTIRVDGYESESPAQFSTLEVAAYQIKKSGFGLALAATGSTASPLQGRAGVQFMKAKPGTWVLYSIASTKLGSESDFRYLAIFQYKPSITENTKAFFRGEWVSSFGYEDSHRFSANLLRVGVAWKEWQFGAGSEILWLGKSFHTQKRNFGLFFTRLF